MCFLLESLFKVFSSGQSNVRSRTSMTTCCVVNANMDSGDPSNQKLHDKTWIFLPSDSLPIARERCLELSNRHFIRNTCHRFFTRLRIDGIKVMSCGLSGGKQKIKRRFNSHAKCKER